MQVILLERVENLGKLGTEVKVKTGYARNYLIPQKKAVYANAENRAKFEIRRAELEKEAAEILAAANKRKVSLDGLEITVAARTSAEGKLFGSVGVTELTQAILDRGIEVEKREIRLPGEGPIRQVGEYEIVVHIHSEVNIPVKVVVVAEGEEEVAE